jgi:hypothetical protein
MALPLTIREDKKEIYVQGLSEYNVKGIADTLALLRLADNNRAIRDTAMNQLSSRSHSIFQVRDTLISSDDFSNAITLLCCFSSTLNIIESQQMEAK